MSERVAIRRPPGVAYLALAGVLGAIVYAHRAALGGMVELWDRSPMYSFGYIVPLVSAFLIWTRRKLLTALPLRPAPLVGITVIGGGLLAAVAGHLAGVQVVQQLAFLVALTGAAFLLFGVLVVRTVWVALGYLLLMVPFWDALTEPLHLPFQKLSAASGVRMLQAIGIPALQQDVMLYLPNVTLEVARACSGVNYVVAVLALGIPLAYLYIPAWWRRLVLIVSAVIVAAVSNSLRVTLIGMLSYWDVGSPLHGPFHVLHGLFVSGVGYIVLFVGLRLLTPPTPAPRDAVAASAPAGVASGPTLNLPVAAGLVVLYLLAGAFPMTYVPARVKLIKPIESVPVRIGAWFAEGAASPDTVFWKGAADQELHRRYVAPGQPAIEVSLAHFERQSQSREIVGNSGDTLHRGATVGSMEVAGGCLDMNIVLLHAGGRRRAAIFWYDVGGRTLADRYLVKWMTLWNTVVCGRSDGMFVAMFADRPEGLNDQEVLDRMRQFATLLHDGVSTLTRQGCQP